MPGTAPVFARYLTVGGATVEVTHRLNALNPPEPFATLASCSACPAQEEVGHWFTSGAHFDNSFTEEHDEEWATGKAREWAQAHAEKCRAIPMNEQ